ncbi:hypothetical protein BDW59DRAFT_151797 [Aspergillus cavernicola]|uniref:HNH nuclease domain-containing protein n=1 Tax=Aspergillus cavernicola TaxID=176166 RepID=A0ABR4HTR9_9EURO
MEGTIDIAPEVNDAERAQLIEKISALTGIKHVDSATWSCLWFSDVKRLQELFEVAVQESRQGPIFATLYNLENARALRSWAAQCRKGNDEKNDIPNAAQVPRKRRIEEGPSEEATPSEATPSEVAPLLKRSAIAKNLCLQRDRETCIVTNAGEPIEVCHIFPYTMGNPSSEVHKFWGILSTFWTTERINDWKQRILGDGRTEVCQNLLTLCPNAHRLWGRARFALQPVKLSEDQKSLTLRFFWLPTRKFTKRMSISTCPSPPAALESGPKYAKLFDCLSEIKVCSGHEITMNTDDPHNKPLPSVELLQMQWTLNRIAAISGAADVDDEELDDTDDEDDEEVLIERSSY